MYYYSRSEWNKWFQVLLSNTNSSIQLYSYVCTQLNGFKYSKWLNSPTWPIDGILISTTTSDQSGTGSNGNKEVLYIPQALGLEVQFIVTPQIWRQAREIWKIDELQWDQGIILKFNCSVKKKIKLMTGTYPCLIHIKQIYLYGMDHTPQVGCNTRSIFKQSTAGLLGHWSNE